MRPQITPLSCACGSCRLEVEGTPFLVTECLCSSCRAAAARLQVRADRPLLTANSGTTTAEYRKDKVGITGGHDHLRAFRLSDAAGTRRVVAGCCGTPLFQEMKGAHWLSIYCHLWPKGTEPTPQLRTMTADASDIALPQDIPNLASHSVAFYWRLLVAWAAMGFRTPDLGPMERYDA